MTDLVILSAAAAAAAPTRLDPVKLFLDADIVVQLVMAGLLLASIWVWMIIISFSLRIRKARSLSAEYEKTLWNQSGDNPTQEEKERVTSPAGRVVATARVSGSPVRWKARLQVKRIPCPSG